jgi:hypothetical protein
MADNKDTRNWPELAVGLYDKLTGRGAQINYEFENLEIHVPSQVGAEAEHAKWRLNGRLRITTEERNK